MTIVLGILGALAALYLAKPAASLAAFIVLGSAGLHRCIRCNAAGLADVGAVRRAWYTRCHSGMALV